jgi:RNA polymerase sigma factor (sigma-70 family)
MAETTQLLQRWRDGDQAALGEILGAHLPWVRQHVRERLGPELRQKLATEDIVQDAMVDFLRNGPRFVPADTTQLRALLARIVGNSLSDQSNWFRAARRRMSMETAIQSSVELSRRAPEAEPAECAIAREQELRLRMAMELLSERDRQLLVWREWEKLPFAAIGIRLDVDAEAARAASRRAVERLRDTMTKLRLGDIDGALAIATA